MVTFEGATFGSVRNRRVQFQVSDVRFPGREKILEELHGRDVLGGRVIDVSDGGPEGETFLVVEVEGLAQPVVVPVTKILHMDVVE